MSETLGTSSDLQLIIPSSGATDWATSIKDDCFQKIVDHDHEATSGSGKLLRGYKALDPTESIAAANTYLLGRSTLVDGTSINMIKINASDELEFGTVATLITGSTIPSPVINVGVSGTAILDEDTMSSDSATQLATQQSIKAYVDAQTSTGTTDEITITGTAVGLADNAVFPGDGAITLPTGTTAERGDVTPTDGMLRFNTTEDRYEGYKSSKSDWSTLGGGVGSLTLIKSYKAVDDGTTAWTAYSVDSLLPDFDGSTAFGANEGDFAGESTGDALFSNDNADKVYKFTAESASQYSAVGFDLNIPKYARGKDIGASFFYRTEDTADTSADADWMVWVFDQTNGVNTTFAGTPGTFAAGDTFAVTAAGTMAVGDKVWVEEASQVVETHITSVSTNDLTLADAVTVGTGDRVITGVLTDVLTTIDAADSDTNEVGEKFQVTFLPPETCAQVTFMVQQLSSETDVELYFDAVAFDSSPFSAISTQASPEMYRTDDAQGYGSTNTQIPYYKTTPTSTTISKTGTIGNDSTNGWSFTAKQRCMVNMSVTAEETTSVYTGISLNSSQLTTGIDLTTDGSQLAINYESVGAGGSVNASAQVIMEKGDVIRPHFGLVGAPSTTDSLHALVLTATPLANASVVVESTDSVISGWTDYTPTFTGFGTPTAVSGQYRRVGDSMECAVSFTAGTTTTVKAAVSLPSGYFLDGNKLTVTGNADTTYGDNVGDYTISYAATSRAGTLVTAPGSNTSNIYFGYQQAGGADHTVPSDATTFAVSGYTIILKFSVPIAGWDANPKPLLSFPTVSYGQEPEHAFLSGHNSYGSTATKIAEFQNEIYNTLSNLGTLVTDSTNGTVFTATARCKVSVSFTWGSTSNGTSIGITKNASSVTTAIYSLAESEVVAHTSSGDGSRSQVVSWVGILEPGDVIRPHTAGDAVQTDNIYDFKFSILAEPIVGTTNQAAIISQPVAFVEDQKASSTEGGTSSATPTARDLNTLSGDIAAVDVSLNADASNDAFTLNSAGKYLIEWSAPAFDCSQHKSALYNVTTSSYIKTGTSEYINSTDDATSRSLGQWVGTLPAGTELAIYHEVISTKASNGWGVNVGGSLTIDSGAAANELYTQVKITRLK